MAKKDVKKEEKIEEEKSSYAKATEDAGAEVAAEELSEAEILKAAEEREKERKALDEKEKAEAKAEVKAGRAHEHKEKVARKVTVRVKPLHGKKYRKLAEKIEKRDYEIAEAINLVLETNPAKFDATVEMHVKLNEKEKNIRGMVILSGGVVKEKRVLEVMAENVDAVIAEVKAGKNDFDIMIADMKVMPKLATLAKILGPKGLMPSPKAGTAVEDVVKAVAELKAGKAEYRADKQNIVHMAIGKISFGSDRIKQNYQAIFNHLPKRIDSIYLTTSMGPSIKIANKQVSK